MNTMNTVKQVDSSETYTQEATQSIPLTNESIEESTPTHVVNVDALLDWFYKAKDKNPKLWYISVTPKLHEDIVKHLFWDNQYKVRMEEIAWMKYTVSNSWADNNSYKSIIAPLDITRIVAVYGEYEWEQITIEDLFLNNIETW